MSDTLTRNDALSSNSTASTDSGAAVTEVLPPALTTETKAEECIAHSKPAPRKPRKRKKPVVMSINEEICISVFMAGVFPHKKRQRPLQVVGTWENCHISGSFLASFVGSDAPHFGKLYNIYICCFPIFIDSLCTIKPNGGHHQTKRCAP